MDSFEGASILVVEDDVDLSYIMQMQLNAAGFCTDVAHDLKEINSCLSEKQYNLVVLDYMLPDTDGISVCTHIRETSACPIIFASCVVDRDVMMEAFATGGDDYIVKPVDMEMLIARIKANLRRSGTVIASKKEKRFKQFILDEERHLAWSLTPEGNKGEEIYLSPTEYKLLSFFTSKPDQLLFYNELYRCIWDSDDLGDVRTVMVHVSNLRKKIDNSKTDMIHTVRGAGYIFSDL